MRGGVAENEEVFIFDYDRKILPVGGEELLLLRHAGISFIENEIPGTDEIEEFVRAAAA